MAKQTTVELVDDLTGGKAASTVAFGVDGKAYEIDLNKKNEAALRKALAEFITAAREIKPERETAKAPTRSGSRRVVPTSSERKEKLAAIRDWAAENDIHVAARGRVSAEVEQQFEEAQAGRPIFSAAP